MSRYEVAIETGNAAFAGCAAYEVARILRNLADKLEHRERLDRIRLCDINGNAVGHAQEAGD